MRSPAGALIGAGKSASVVDFWHRDSGVKEGKVFRRVLKNGARQDGEVTANVVRSAVKRCAKPASIANLAPHDLRRSYHEELCYWTVKATVPTFALTEPDVPVTTIV
jgi:hypothetical protein